MHPENGLAFQLTIIGINMFWTSIDIQTIDCNLQLSWHCTASNTGWCGDRVKLCSFMRLGFTNYFRTFSSVYSLCMYRIYEFITANFGLLDAEKNNFYTILNAISTSGLPSSKWQYPKTTTKTPQTKDPNPSLNQMCLIDRNKKLHSLLLS